MEIEKKHLENQTKILEVQLSKVQESKIEIERRNESYKREIDMLTQDKNFLGRERLQLED